MDGHASVLQSSDRTISPEPAAQRRPPSTSRLRSLVKLSERQRPGSSAHHPHEQHMDSSRHLRGHSPSPQPRSAHSPGANFALAVPSPENHIQVSNHLPSKSMSSCLLTFQGTIRRLQDKDAIRVESQTFITADAQAASAKLQSLITDRAEVYITEITSTCMHACIHIYKRFARVLKRRRAYICSSLSATFHVNTYVMHVAFLC